MSAFNENDFLLELEDTITLEQPEDVLALIHQEIDRECTYYSDCFDIVKALNFTSWENNDFGDITNIQKAAFVALYEWVQENISLPVEKDSFVKEINSNLMQIIK